MNKLVAVVCALFCVLHGVGSAETEHSVKGMSAYKQPSLGHGRKMSAVTADELSAVVFASEVANKGICSMSDRLEPGFKRQGDLIYTQNYASAGSCAHFCRSRVIGCVAINFEQNSKTCYFLETVSSIHKAEGYTTAFVGATKTSVCDGSGMIYGYTRPGNNMPGSPYRAKRAVECCALCFSTPKCIAYAYVVDKRDCYLKDAISDLLMWGNTMTGVVCVD